MAKKTPAKKAPAKRKPRAKKPVNAAIQQAIREAETFLIKPPKSIAWRSWLVSGARAAALIVCGVVAGIYAAGGIEVGPGPVGDVLQQSYSADRVTQVAVLRDLATQPFDGTTDDGRKQAGEWFNAQRFHNRANDFGAYTDAVSEAIAGNTEAELAKKLEGK